MTDLYFGLVFLALYFVLIFGALAPPCLFHEPGREFPVDVKDPPGPEWLFP